MHLLIDKLALYITYDILYIKEHNVTWSSFVYCGLQ